MNQKEFFAGYARGTLKPDARLGNVYIIGTVVYSYGSHFPLAKKDGGRVWVNADKYSVSTSRHQGILRKALTQAGYEIENTNTKSLREMI